jgi:hypothetical protein
MVSSDSGSSDETVISGLVWQLWSQEQLLFCVQDSGDAEHVQTYAW